MNRKDRFKELLIEEFFKALPTTPETEWSWQPSHYWAIAVNEAYKTLKNEEKEEKQCKYCYGKGFASQMSQEIGRDDFGGEGYSKTIFRDIPCKKCGNYFRTLEEAEQKLEEVKQILY